MNSNKSLFYASAVSRRDHENAHGQQLTNTFVLRHDEVHHVNAKNQKVSTERAAPNARTRDRVGCPRNNRGSSSAKGHHRPCPSILSSITKLAIDAPASAYLSCCAK